MQSKNLFIWEIERVRWVVKTEPLPVILTCDDGQDGRMQSNDGSGNRVRVNTFDSLGDLGGVVVVGAVPETKYQRGRLSDDPATLDYINSNKGNVRCPYPYSG